MKAQKPAKGISLNESYGDGSTFLIQCECTDPDHSINCWIEVKRDCDMDVVSVEHYVTVSHGYHGRLIDRLKAAFEILFSGESKRQATLLLDEQAATNFVSAINGTIKSLKK